MTTIYLLDALFILVMGMTALFAFGLTTSRHTHMFKIIFLVSLLSFLFTLLIGYLQAPDEVAMPPPTIVDGKAP